MQQALPWITLGVQIVAFLLLYLHQRNIIKTQAASIQSMKDFHQIFNIEEVKRYVNMTSETNKMEMDALKKQMEQAHIDSEATVNFFVGYWGEQVALKRELIMLVANQVASYPPAEREAVAKRVAPMNAEMIMKLIESAKI